MPAPDREERKDSKGKLKKNLYDPVLHSPSNPKNQRPKSKTAKLELGRPATGKTSVIRPKNSQPQTVVFKQDGKTYAAKIALVNGKVKIVGSPGARAQSAAARANRKKK